MSFLTIELSRPEAAAISARTRGDLASLKIPSVTLVRKPFSRSLALFLALLAGNIKPGLAGLLSTNRMRLKVDRQKKVSSLK